MHAISLSTNRSEGIAWWNETTSTLLRVLKRKIPTIFLADTNLHLGRTRLRLVGSVEGEKVCEGGRCFHSLLLEFQVMVFAAFLGGGPTWRSTAGCLHRIDFVDIPVEWSPAVRSATTHPKVASSLQLFWRSRGAMICGGITCTLANAILRAETPSASQSLGKGSGLLSMEHLQLRSTWTWRRIFVLDHLGYELSEDLRGAQDRLGFAIELEYHEAECQCPQKKSGHQSCDEMAPLGCHFWKLVKTRARRGMGEI